jgi:hypothetical protein
MIIYNMCQLLLKHHSIEYSHISRSQQAPLYELVKKKMMIGYFPFVLMPADLFEVQTLLLLADALVRTNQQIAQ